MERDGIDAVIGQREGSGVTDEYAGLPTQPFSAVHGPFSNRFGEVE